LPAVRTDGRNSKTDVNSTFVRPRLGALWRTLVLDIVVPLAVVQAMLHLGKPPATALAIAAVVPLADAVVDFIRTRSLSPVAVLVTAALVVSVILTLLTGYAWIALIQGSLVTCVFGAGFLLSLAGPRPLIFVLGQKYATSGGSAAAATWETQWKERPPFRAGMRLLTTVWGLGLVGDALVRMAVVTALPPARAALVSPAVDAVTIFALIAYTNFFARRAAHRIG
jgi:hypothetical protein